MAATAVGLVGLAVVDPRTLGGAPAWFKPLKFAISFVAYAGALAWMLGQLRVPALRRAGWVIVVASVIEMAIITGQAARGVRSHFNDDDGHAVGVPDGGPGLFLVGWSTTGGDLRIGHFVGMHALQLLPLLAAGLAALGLGAANAHPHRGAAAAGYLGVVLLLTWQTLRAQPLLAPDGLTLGALAVVVLGTGAALILATRPADRARIDA